MVITRTINEKEIKIELTEDELLEACKAHFAKQNEEYIKGFVDEDEDFDHMSVEEKEDMIKDIAYRMVDYITVEGDDYEAFYECSEDYRGDTEDDDFDDDVFDDDDEEDE